MRFTRPSYFGWGLVQAYLVLVHRPPHPPMAKFRDICLKLLIVGSSFLLTVGGWHLLSYLTGASTNHRFYEALSKHLPDLRFYDAEPKVVIVLTFSPLDCWRCLEELITMSLMRQKFSSDLVVVGIARTESQTLVEDLIRMYQLSFPIIQDSSGEATMDILGRTNLSMRYVFLDGHLMQQGAMGIRPNSEAGQELENWIHKELLQR